MSNLARGNPHLREDEEEGKENPVVRVVQFRALNNLSDCDAAPYLRFFLVRNEEAEGSNPFSSSKIEKTSVGRSKKARLSPRTLLAAA